MIYKATEIKITKTKLVIGVPEPFKLLHVTDSHLIYSDDQDSDMQRKLMAMRREAYDSKHGDNCCRRWCDALFQYAKDNGELLVHTGDLIDYVSHGNLVQARAVMDTLDDYFFVAGNHEFTQYMGFWPGDPDFRAKNEASVKAVFKNDISCCAREYKGVNLVGLETKKSQISAEQLNFLRAQFDKGLPVLLFYHEPFYTPGLYNRIVTDFNEDDHQTLGEPDVLHPGSSYRATNETLAFMELVKNHPLMKGAFTGHFHFTYNDPLPSGAQQYLTAGSFLGMAREIEIV